MRVKLFAFLGVFLVVSPAAAEDVRVRNDDDTPIFQLFAWPSDLMASTENLIVVPIESGEIKTVSVDNDWSDCKFTFLVDPNDPDDLRKASYIKKDMYINVINICHRNGKPISLKDVDPNL